MQMKFIQYLVKTDTQTENLIFKNIHIFHDIYLPGQPGIVNVYNYSRS